MLIHHRTLPQQKCPHLRLRVLGTEKGNSVQNHNMKIANIFHEERAKVQI
jgi:hypothetical protein